jgi:hypothetical protein
MTAMTAMTETTLDLPPACGLAQRQARYVLKETLQMVDLTIESFALALWGAGKAVAGKVRRPKTKERPLQVVRAMTMVNDHVWRDVGLDRSAVGVISELSTEEIRGCRMEREVS